MINKNVLIIVALLVPITIVLFILSFIQQSNKDVSATLRINPATVQTYTLTIDNQKSAIANANPLTLTLKKGSHTIKVSADGYEDNTTTVAVKKSGQIIAVDVTESNKNAAKTLLDTVAANSTVDVDNGMTAKDVVFFENNTWGVGMLVTSKKSTDGEQAIIKLQNNKWTVVLVGTGIDTESMQNAQVPSSVQKHMEAL